MPSKNPFSDFFAKNDFSELFKGYQAVPFDLQSFMETQRKNIQALTDAQQIAVENIQAIAQRQSAILSQIVEDNATITKQLMTEGTPEEKIAKNADLFKSAYERSVKNMNEIAEMMNQSNQEAGAIINKRVTATMTEVKSALEKAQEKTQSSPPKKKAA